MRTKRFHKNKFKTKQIKKMTKIAELNEYQRRALETWLHANDTGYNIIDIRLMW